MLLLTMLYVQVLGEFNKFIVDCKALPREMQWTARSLIANEQGGPFPLLSVATHQPPKCRTLTALVVHTAAVFFSRQKLEVLWPFINILTDPAKLAVSKSFLLFFFHVTCSYCVFRMPTCQRWPKITYKKQGVHSEAHSMVFLLL